MLANEAAHKDVLDIIAPEDKEKKRKNPPPAQTGVALELCHHCFKEIRSSSTTTASKANLLRSKERENVGWMGWNGRHRFCERGTKG